MDLVMIEPILKGSGKHLRRQGRKQDKNRLVL